MMFSDRLEHRDIVPRWLSVGKTVAKGEWRPTLKQREVFSTLAPHTVHFNKRLEEWMEYRDWESAEELITTACVTGETDHIGVISAAEYYLENAAGAAGIKKICTRIIGGGNSATQSQLDTSASISLLRTIVTNYPRNSLAWSELARQYALSGSLDKAKKAMMVAYQLSDGHRYIVRNSVRLAFHLREPDLAFYFANIQNAQVDPWLAAALVSSSKASDRSVPYWRRLRTLLSNDNFSQFSKSELASSIATVMVEGGENKLARKMFQQSIVEPTENSLAQFVWASRTDEVLRRQVNVSVGHEQAFEASAWLEFYSGHWQESLEHTSKWMDIERFSVAPYVHGSYVSSVVGDYERVISIAKLGLTCNPEDAMLLNNRAYGEISLGNKELASQTLVLAKRFANRPEERLAVEVTEGFKKIRFGSVSEGVGKYKEAIRVTKADLRNKLRAIAYLARALSDIDADACRLLCKMSFAKLDKIDKHGSSTADIRKVLKDACEIATISIPRSDKPSVIVENLELETIDKL